MLNDEPTFATIRKERKQRLSAMHRKFRVVYLKTLFDGSLPVFVAALINRAVVAVIAAIVGNGNTSSEIAVNFVYAFCIAHVICYLIVLNMSPSKNDLFGYWFRISIENAGFAWMTTATLIILRWLYNSGYPDKSFVAWIVLVAIVITLIVLANVFEFWILKPKMKIKMRLRTFVSEVFALPVAYTFTVIVASLVYQDTSTSYLSGIDDDTSVTRGGPDVGGNCFILYVLGVTAIVYLSQIYFNFQGGEDVDVENDDGHEDEEEEEEEEGEGEGERGREHEVEMEGGITKQLSLRSIDSAISTYINPKGYTWGTLKMLWATCAGYWVGCSWYVWSVLTFQRLFSDVPHGDVLGLAIYSAIITAVVVHILATMTATDEETRLTGPLAVHRRGQVQLTLSAGHLVVGWSWQEFITAGFAVIVGERGGTVEGAWVSAIVKCVVAVVVAVAGSYIERQRQQQMRQSSRSVNGGADSAQYSSLHPSSGGGHSGSGSGGGDNVINSAGSSLDSDRDRERDRNRDKLPHKVADSPLLEGLL